MSPLTKTYAAIWMAIIAWALTLGALALVLRGCEISHGVTW